MEMIFEAWKDVDNKLVAANVLQIGRKKKIESVYHLGRDLPVRQEEGPESVWNLFSRLVYVTVVYPDGKHHRHNFVDALIKQSQS